eukprot:scaffold7242_cov400-Prasinococcus_capsulatus_cf.AAC.12
MRSCRCHVAASSDAGPGRQLDLRLPACNRVHPPGVFRCAVGPSITRGGSAPPFLAGLYEERPVAPVRAHNAVAPQRCADLAYEHSIGR